MTTATDRVLDPVVKIGGSSLAAATFKKLTQLRVELSLWMPNRCTLRFTDDDLALVNGSTFEIAKTVAIELPNPQGTASAVFSGEVTDIALDPTGRGGYELVVGALDKSHRLTSQSVPRTFANQTFSAIAQTVAGGCGLTAAVDATSATIPYVVQTGTDFDLLAELALRCGYEWWVDDTTINFKKRASTAGSTLTYGKGLYEFRVRYSGIGLGKEMKVNGWAPDTQAAVTATDTTLGSSQSSVPAIGATASLVTGGRSKAVSTSNWGKSLSSSAYAVTTAGEATAVASALAARVSASEVTARGVAQATPALKPGKKVTIAGMGTKVNGDYFVTTVEHVYAPKGPAPNLRTKFTAGNKAPVALADLVGGSDRDRARRFEGLVVGQVTNIKDDPDGYGRVKCKFPALSTTLESAWCRVATPGGGDKRGFQFTPEVNDEVIVGFEHGDLRYPVILGGVWSKTKKPPQVPAESPVKTRQIKSKGEHIMEFGDGSADTEQHIRFELKGAAHKLRLGKDKFDIEMPDGKAITIKAGSAEVSIAASGAITIKSKTGQKITVDAGTGDLELKGQNVKVTAMAGVDVKANAAVNIKGNAPSTLESAAILTVKGAMVKIN